MRITVTPLDIVAGKPQDAEFCPIGLACARALGCESYAIDITEEAAWLGGDYYRLPFVAQEFIRAFDAGQAVDPIEFDLTDADLADPELPI